MSKALLLLGTLWSIGFQASAGNQFLMVSKNCNVRVTVQSPSPDDAVRADVLFLIGFSDRADNHGPLFDKMTRAGFRVISFDYPSHGETECGSLNEQNISSLGNMASEVLARVAGDSTRPLYLTGWSTGGLIAMRMAQLNLLPKRQILGLVLLAPGLAVRPIPGDWGLVTMPSLLSNPNPPHMGPIKPDSPFSFMKFSLSLMGSGLVARNSPIPQIPILFVLGGEEADLYADTATMKRWIRVERWFHPELFAVQCAEGKHELDNEIEPMGSEVRSAFVDFLVSPVAGSLKSGIECRPL